MIPGVRVLDLFAGMGGFSLGFAGVLGRDAVTGIDLWPRAMDAYGENVGHAVQMDLSREEPDGDPDVIIGGPPCRPWSSVNLRRRRAAHGDYALVRRFYGIVMARRPRVFVMENVPALARDRILLDALRDVRGHYAVKRITVSYSDYGAATSRRRLFVIGAGEPAVLQGILLGLERARSPAATVRDAMGDLEGIGRAGLPDHEWSEVRTIGRYSDKYATGSFGWYRLEWDRPAPSFGNVSKTYTLHPSGERVISVREAMRIMGFPDAYVFPRGTPLHDRYQMVADAVSPVFSRALAEAILNGLMEHERRPEPEELVARQGP